RIEKAMAPARIERDRDKDEIAALMQDESGPPFGVEPRQQRPPPRPTQQMREKAAAGMCGAATRQGLEEAPLPLQSTRRRSIRHARQAPRPQSNSPGEPLGAAVCTGSARVCLAPSLFRPAPGLPRLRSRHRRALSAKAFEHRTR